MTFDRPAISIKARTDDETGEETLVISNEGEYSKKSSCILGPPTSMPVMVNSAVPLLATAKGASYIAPIWTIGLDWSGNKMWALYDGSPITVGREPVKFSIPMMEPTIAGTVGRSEIPVKFTYVKAPGRNACCCLRPRYYPSLQAYRYAKH